MVGDSGAGKTTMGKCFYNGPSSPFPIEPNDIERLAAPLPTSEFHYFRGISKAHYQDYNRIGVKIYDAGGEVLAGYGSVLQQYYADSRGAMIVYDAHDRNSFERVKTFWYSEIQRVKSFVGKNLQTMVIAMTRAGEEAQVDMLTAQSWANGVGMQFCEVFDGKSCADAYQVLIEDM